MLNVKTLFFFFDPPKNQIPKPEPKTLNVKMRPRLFVPIHEMSNVEMRPLRLEKDEFCQKDQPEKSCPENSSPFLVFPESLPAELVFIWSGEGPH